MPFVSKPLASLPSCIHPSDIIPSRLHLRPARPPTPIPSLLSAIPRRVRPSIAARPYSTSSTHEGPSFAAQAARSKFGLGKLVLMTVPFITFGLGTWQVQRLRWKTDLIARLEERMSKAAIPLPKRISDKGLDEYEYRRVWVTGRFLHDQEMLLGPRSRGDGVSGYFLVTPLEREDGSRVLVKRGWVAREKRDKATRSAGLEEETVTVEGLLRKSERRNAFTPDNVPEQNQWFYIDLPAMSSLTGATPLLVDQISTESPSLESQLVRKGYPVGRSPTVEVRNTHFQYIITWYSLTIATSVMLYILLKKPVQAAGAMRQKSVPV